MPLTDEEYLKKFGKSREEVLAERKERSKVYARKYYRENIKGKKRGKKRGRKKGSKALTVRKKTIPIKAHLHTGSEIVQRLTMADLIVLEEIRRDAMQMQLSGINAYLDAKSRRNGHG